MNDLIVQRQCEELTTDTLLEAQQESEAEEFFRATAIEREITADDVRTINLGLAIQSTYRKFQQAEHPQLKQVYAAKLSSLISEEFRQRSKEWTSSQREQWYDSQGEYEPEFEENPF